MALRAALSVPDPREVHVRISAMRRRHLRPVLRIETQVYPRPWTPSLFAGEIAQRDSRCYIVARVANTVVGYAGQLYTFDEAHVTNIAVDPAWHRHKIGTRLLLALAREARRRGATSLTLEVRLGNKAAQNLYRRFGFRPVGVRKNYYAETKEDALVMWAEDVGGEEYGRLLDAIDDGIPGTTEVEDQPL